MKTVEFRIVCDYTNNKYRIKAVEPDTRFERYNRLCQSVSEVMLRTFMITRDLKINGERAVFSYE